jgi:hypothetical protein
MRARPGAGLIAVAQNFAMVRLVSADLRIFMGPALGRFRQNPGRLPR